MEIKIVIPVHLASRRLERKALIDIEGLPMIEHVRRRAMLSKGISDVYIATGDKEIKNITEKYGGKVILTKQNHQNGTSRVAEAISNIDCSHVLLVQGDEPLLIPHYIDLFIEGIKKSNTDKMWNAITRFKEMNFVHEHSLVKCFLDINNHIISCFREVPVSSQVLKFKKILFKMHGLIAYEKNFLEELVSLKETKYSKLESIEQMKAIEYGFKIKTVELPEDFPSVNTESELEIVKNILANNLNQQELFNSIIK
tara:strand:- start:16932 stop:17696 length:765 start_codon:yes stop_codon:yes gene_type:complete